LSRYAGAEAYQRCPFVKTFPFVKTMGATSGNITNKVGLAPVGMRALNLGGVANIRPTVPQATESIPKEAA
jgi:hypothetical protein